MDVSNIWSAVVWNVIIHFANLWTDLWFYLPCVRGSFQFPVFSMWASPLSGWLMLCPRFGVFSPSCQRQTAQTSLRFWSDSHCKNTITRKYMQPQENKHNFTWDSAVSEGTHESSVNMWNSLIIVNCHLQVKQTLAHKASLLQGKASHRSPIKVPVKRLLGELKPDSQHRNLLHL